MTPSQQSAKTFVAKFLRDLDHRRQIERIREGGRALRESMAGLRRAEEQFSARCIKSRYQGGRLSPKGLSIATAARFHQLRLAEANITLPEDQPFIATWRAHVESEARTLGAEIVWAETHDLNAYAFVRLGRIEIGPIRSARSYVTGLHECGHVARPCTAKHTRVPSGDGLKGSCCPQCEVIVWRWAIDRARPTWTQRMHACLAESLATYRKYAADQPTIAAEIDSLCSPAAFNEARQMRVKEIR